MIDFRFQAGFRPINGSDLNTMIGQANASFGVAPQGKVLYVDTVNGSDSFGAPGTSWEGAYQTMAKALSEVTDNSVIYFDGKVREQLVAPLGITGVTIIGAAGGAVRDDDGAKWYAPAAPVAGQALLELREQGWTLANFLMTPDATGGACVKAHRAEDASYPDSSHNKMLGMRFVGGGGTPIGYEDVGGNHHCVISGCEFQTLTTAIKCSSTAIAVPLRNQFTNNLFLENTNDIDSAQSYGLLEGNRFFTDSTKTVVIAGGGHCVVTGNIFPNAAADIDPAHGYDGNATDVWTGNLVTDQAAFVFGDPA